MRKKIPNNNALLQAQEIAHKKTILESRPSTYNIELTGRCNCNPPCVFCVWKNLPGYIAPGNLDFSIIENSWASLGQAERINDCSYGEPLLYPEFESFVEKLSAASIRFGFSTNGLLLNERKARFLVRHARNLEFVVSLNAATPETYYKLHGQDFTAVVGNIRRFANLYRAEYGDKELPLILSCIVMRANRDEVMEFLSLAQSLGVTNVMLRPLFDFVVGYHYLHNSFGYEFDYRSEILEPEFYQELETRVRNSSEFSDMTLSYQWSAQDSFVAEMLDKDSAIPCLFPWRFLNIRNLHDMYLPCMFLEESIGSPSKTTVGDIWNCETLIEMRESLAGGEIPHYCIKHSVSCPLVLEKGPQVSRSPVIAFHPPSLEASYAKGKDDAFQGLSLWNSGGGILSYSISTGADWLRCDPPSGTSTGQLTPTEVHYNLAALEPGTYASTITIDSPNAANTPQSVAVNLTVTPDRKRKHRRFKKLFRKSRRR